MNCGKKLPPNAKWPDKRCLIQGILKGTYHCTIDLLFDWFRINCMTTEFLFVCICKTDKSKPVKQEINSTVIPPCLVFPGLSPDKTVWLISQLTKWQNDKMTKWQNDKMTKWQNDKMTKWQNDKMTKWQIDKMTKCLSNLKKKF